MSSSLQVTRGELAQRLKSQTYDFYSQMVFLVKGAVLTAAGFVWIELSPRPPTTETLELWLLFVASCFIVLIPVATYRRGLLFATARVSILDYISPLGMGVAEFAMFTILTQRPDVGEVQVIWLWAVAMHAGFAVVLISTRLALEPIKDFTDDLRELHKEYQGWLKGDRIGALALATSCGAVAWNGRSWGMHDWRATLGPVSADGVDVFVAGVAVIAFIVSMLAMLHHSKISEWLQRNPPVGG